MHFAILGDHDDGLYIARALAATGRHTLATYSGPTAGVERLRLQGLNPRRIGDVEEVLADPEVEAVVVASRLAHRPALLRRALQSERHVLCVHPADQTPDIAYEAALIQGDTRCVLLPLLPEALHPGVRRLAELVRPPAGPIGQVRLLELELTSPDTVVLEADAEKQRHSLPAWNVLRVLGGEIVEVSAFAAREAISPDEPLLLTGRFERGGLFRTSFLPRQGEHRWRLSVSGATGSAELAFPSGWAGPARLRWRNADGKEQEEAFEAWDAWPPLVEVFESALAAANGGGASPGPGRRVTWEDEIRSLELDDAARRSVERRRVSPLEYPEATEEVGFKGTMTLIGCGVLWASLFLLILSHWVPWLGWAIGPVLVIFLGLQVLRWAIPGKKSKTPVRPEP
jgi:predicted dehydrogenase